MAGFVVPLITAGLSGLSSLFGSHEQKTTQTQNTNNSSSSTPNLNALQSELLNTAGFQALKRVNDGPSDVNGIVGAGLNQLNQSSKARQLAITNVLKQRGLSFSPNAGFVQAQEEGNRVNEQDQFLQQIPTLQRQMQQQDFANLLASIGPVGTNTTGTSSTNGTLIGPPKENSGFLSGLIGGLGAPTGPGQGSGLSSILKTIGLGGGNG